MKWRAFCRMPQWVRLSEWLGVTFSAAGAAAAVLVGRCIPVWDLYWLALYDRVVALELEVGRLE